MNNREYIISFLDEASKAYYNGNPIISDEQFDYLAELVWYNKVGTADSNTKKHYRRMYSQQKYYYGEGSDPLMKYVSDPKVITPKLDGAAIEALYIGGELVQVLTRGDGIEGRDVTSKFILSSKSILPKFIDFKQVVQVSGEITTDKEVQNARNYASGALNLIDQEEFNSRVLYFTAYDVYPTTEELYSRSLEELTKLGFKTVLDEEWCSKFETDGKVIRINSNKIYNALGFTAKHPRGSFALKERKTGAVSKILDIVWQTGKSGKVTPVAILEPCVVEGATISRATLNNIGFIKALGVDIGSVVEVQRSGGIIPTIVRVIE